jgi:hypothetical protein
MRTIAVAAVALALSACGGSGSEPAANEVNALTPDNMMMDENLLLESSNLTNGAAGMDANGSVNAATANLMEKDAVTNDPDTNLANGI